MFVAIIGTRCSGKSTVLEYLVQYKGYTRLSLTSLNGTEAPTHGSEALGTTATARERSSHVRADQHRPVSFLMMSSPTSTYFTFPKESQVSSSSRDGTHYGGSDLCFQTASDLLEFVTRNWLSDFVTMDLNTTELLEEFSMRPFFMIVSMDAPILVRFRRDTQFSLEEFIRDHDQYLYGRSRLGASSQDIRRLAHVHIVNSFDAISLLYAHLDDMDLVNPERLRPRWDTYFMQLAALASLRSNCMKRRVGAILVRNNRILATGYNGTPRGLTNCNEGGCTRCNTGSETSDECVCLHAEENALLEAGRERVGDGAVLYCNTCPCLKCTIKIIQTGVKEVVYNLSYKVDDASAALFREAGVAMRRHAPPQG